MNEPEDFTDDESGMLFRAEIRDRHGVSSPDLDAQFIAPDYHWKGCAFWAYRHGTRLFYHQVTRPGDTLYNVLAFLFLHLKQRPTFSQRNGYAGYDDAAHFENVILPLVTEPKRFARALWEWLNSLGKLTEADETAAMNLFNKMMDDAGIGAVETRGGSAGAKKKVRVTGAKKRGRVKPRSSSTPARGSASAAARRAGSSSGVARSAS